MSWGYTNQLLIEDLRGSSHLMELIHSLEVVLGLELKTKIIRASVTFALSIFRSGSEKHFKGKNNLIVTSI